jgi:hypothetical protein
LPPQGAGREFGAVSAAQPLWSAARPRAAFLTHRFRCGRERDESAAKTQRTPKRLRRESMLLLRDQFLESRIGA